LKKYSYYSQVIQEEIPDMHSNGDMRVLKSQMKIDPENLSLELERFIAGHVERMQRDGVILGLSGGLDSAVVAALCKRALGSEKILALMMPEKDSEKSHVVDAQKLAEELNIKTRKISITPHLKQLGVYGLFPLSKIPFTRKLRANLRKKGATIFKQKTGETVFSATRGGIRGTEYDTVLRKGTAYYRIKHRMRMVLLYFFGELENRLIVGAANKTEALIGYFVKHGCDDATDIMPIVHLYKTQVRELARYLNIPSGIIEKPPSPDLMPGTVDEDAIGMSYEKLDLILLALEKGWEAPRIAGVMGIEESDIIYVMSLKDKSEHMRNVYDPALFP
jgi:NAD+ synthase